MPKEIHNPECLVPIVKHGDGSVMIWTAITWYSADPIIILNGQITASDYVDILGSQVLQFLRMIVHPYTNPEVFSLGLRSMKIFLNIIEPLWSVIDSGVRSKFPSPSSLKQLEDVLVVQWYSIPLETIQNLMSLFQEVYKLYCRQMVAQLHINKEMYIFHNCP